jgi:tryptophan 7-halogenase
VQHLQVPLAAQFSAIKMSENASQPIIARQYRRAWVRIMQRVDSVLVLGGGSAGFLAAMTLKTRLPDLPVSVLRSKEISIIRVGESTTVALPGHVFGYLGIDPGEFYRETQATWKLGIRFLWGSRPHFDYTFGRQLDWKWSKLRKNNGFYLDDDFRCGDVHSALMSLNKVFVRQPNGDPLIGRDFGLHLENERFVKYLERRAARLGVQIVEDTVKEVRKDAQGITALVLASGRELRADLYVDCSGFRALLLGQALGESYHSFKASLFCDRAVAGGWPRTTEPIQPYTTAETMNCGWCWQIDHADVINRGYVYCSAFIGDSAAEEEFRAKNPKVGPTFVVRFSSGRYARCWAQNVVAVGNACGFVEPLESTALAVICDESRFLADALLECERQPTRTLIANHNHLVGRAWDDIRNFLSIHYRFNTRLDTPFWRACRKDVDLGGATALVDFYQENGPSTFARNTLLHGTDIFGMEGYLALLLGQQVPYRRTHRPGPDELRIWEAVRNEHRTKAQGGLDTVEALAAIRSPAWRWNPNYYSA